MLPLDFEEYLYFKGNTEALRQLGNIPKLRGQKIDTPFLYGMLKEFLVFGGYPEVVLTENANEKVKILTGIFDLYAKKDLVIDKIHRQIPVGIKFKIRLKQNDFTGLKTFLRQYPHTGKSFLINPAAQYNEETFNISIRLPYLVNRITD